MTSPSPPKPPLGRNTTDDAAATRSVSLCKYATLLVSLVALVSIGGAGAAGTDVLIGSQSVGGNNDAISAGSAQAFNATASATGQLTSLQIYVNAPTSVSSVTAGVYSDASGHRDSSWPRERAPPTAVTGRASHS